MCFSDIVHTTGAFHLAIAHHFQCFRLKSVAVNLPLFSVDVIYTRHCCVQCTHTRTQQSMASTEEIKNWKSWERKNCVFFGGQTSNVYDMNSMVPHNVGYTTISWLFCLSLFLHEKEKFFFEKKNKQTEYVMWCISKWSGNVGLSVGVCVCVCVSSISSLFA